ncbi:MAG: hypothetical protein LBM73_01635 [Candidatus Nomurabacteria bacterium]|jgi:uncharacterized protein (TIGR02145 family)|nr:hypothetical protein [Candidatus Nomurabacteria bacterium]
MRADDFTQTLNIKIVDTITPPTAGAAGMTNWLWLAGLILAATLCLFWLFCRIRRGHRAILPAILLVACAGINALSLAGLGNVNAASNVVLASSGLNMTLMKNRSQIATGLMKTTATVKSDSTAGYELLAKVDPAQARTLTNAGISITGQGGNITAPANLLDDQNPTLVINHTGTPSAAGGDKTDFTFAVSVPASTPAGDYKLKVDYSVVEIVPTSATLQTFEANYCQNKMTTGEIVTSTDSRNGQRYRIRKMEDGKCWMIDNLKIDNYTETPADSNVTTNYQIPAAATSGTSEYDTGQVWDPGNPSDYGGTVNENDDSLCGLGEANAGTTTCYGYLYNFYAATAGWGALSVVSGESPQDICPKNWRLPTGRDTGEFAILNAAMAGVTPPSTDNTLYAGWQPDGAFKGVFSGYYDSAFSSQGYVGYFWSSSVYMVYTASYLNYGTANAFPSNGIFKNIGYAVRCVLN